ncbi:hypothetical protein DNTS_034116 [Danionella cerebrum]|uniref:non-specific serine/threonine protein kinase n=1 Tax=Danionella cerebrum TaxID=2873325 RepID=A0A553R6R1_9TELE|nr:hypothetical protein DNTS_034116 [Danionella translucida]
MPEKPGQVSAPVQQRYLYMLTESSECGPVKKGEEEEEQESPSKLLTPLEKLTLQMCNDHDAIKELTFGRRVGFYKVRGQIGCGNFSKVKLATHALTKDKVAIKIMDKMRLDVQTQKMLAREIANMESLYHPNLLQLYEVLETPSRLYLHENNVIHRDLKAENVLFSTNYCIKVADFGFSTKVNVRNQALDTFCGSPPYAAPELFKDDSYVGPPVDVWAMGVMLFFMVTGNLPFRADTIPKLRQSVLEGAYVLPTWVSAPCQRLIRGILKPEPSERCALDQMLGCEWLLPVELFRPLPPSYQLNPVHLLEAGPGELDRDQEEVKGILEELGVTSEHILNNQGKHIRSPINGVYRIVLHRVKKNRGAETPPTTSGVIKDPKRDSLRAYRNLRHSSKLCVMS